MNILKYKKLSDKAITPTRAHTNDAGLDFYASSMEIDWTKSQVTYGTGIAVLIERGFVGKMYMRSSVKDKDQFLSNAVGVIDAGYVGEITFVYNIHGNNFRSFAKFCKHIIWQLRKIIRFDENKNLENSLDNFIKADKDKQNSIYQVGDKIGQLVIEKCYYPEFVPVDEMPETDRGVNGYGSSDRMSDLY